MPKNVKWVKHTFQSFSYESEQLQAAQIGQPCLLRIILSTSSQRQILFNISTNLFHGIIRDSFEMDIDKDPESGVSLLLHDVRRLGQDWAIITLLISMIDKVYFVKSRNFMTEINHPVFFPKNRYYDNKTALLQYFLLAKQAQSISSTFIGMVVISQSISSTFIGVVVISKMTVWKGYAIEIVNINFVMLYLPQPYKEI